MSLQIFQSFYPNWLFFFHNFFFNNSHQFIFWKQKNQKVMILVLRSRDLGFLGVINIQIDLQQIFVSQTKIYLEQEQCGRLWNHLYICYGFDCLFIQDQKLFIIWRYLF
ncbi:unnamed protein product [Paramecium primaurelia]|uniref:Uncharacterized protein n=1 Tax=Paramecium primaurelia TaxID=5886 RepID=A0A8S1QMW9_PARPR|nr:unnamed protein product [Paramecium primaurelia]